LQPNQGGWHLASQEVLRRAFQRIPATLGIAIATASAGGAALISTVIFNVPINFATGRWNRDQPPQDWKCTRNRWEFLSMPALMVAACRRSC
jgi:hypothetical protein